METNINFEKIVDAFLNATSENYFFLSKTIILHTTELNKDQLAELRQIGLIPLPHRSIEFDHKIKEEFVYEITDTKIAEKFFESTSQKHPKKTFEELLTEFNMLQNYKVFERKIIKNTLINWTVKAGVNLPGQMLADKTEIKQVEEKTIPDEMKSLSPIKCNKCADTHFDIFFYKFSPALENVLMEEDAKKQLLTKGIEKFNFLGETRHELISTAFCKNCKSNDITWDFV